MKNYIRALSWWQWISTLIIVLLLFYIGIHLKRQSDTTDAAFCIEATSDKITVDIRLKDKHKKLDVRKQKDQVSDERQP